MTIKQYLSMLDYFKSRDEMSYIFLYILAITGAGFSDVINMIEKEGIIHLKGTKTANANRFVEVTTKDVKHIKSKLSKLPRFFDGKLFKISHNAVAKAFNHAREHIGLDDNSITPYVLRHTHTSYFQKAYQSSISVSV